MKKRAIFLLTILISIIILISLLKTIYKTYQSSKRLSLLEEEVQGLEKEREGLEKVLVERKSQEFLEKEARDKLNLVKPGETLVVLEITEGTEELQEGTERDISKLSNPQKWWDLFFGR